MLSQELFLKLLGIERKRTERSGRRFVLMLLETGNLLKPDRPRPVSTLLAAIARATRATDLTGWYQEGSIIGVIFTEIGSGSDTSVVHSISSSLTDSLYSALTIQQINEIKLSFHLFPEDWADPDSNGPVTSTVRLALAGELHRKKGSLLVKRMIDIVGSIAALLFLLPVMVMIACAIKLTSKGPVIFRQVRLGQYGKKFTFLKFRSMYTGRDHTIHKEYVTQFIEGTHKVEDGGSQQPLYKLTADPRITRVGRFLRNTSLDELPQFINVLRGEMSLVGPRPPVLYEFECYDLWHKRRLLAVKPGITGLWQVDGRSRVKFDEMVRLDIRYARSWSLWLDLKILLQTPRAVLSRSGAC
jgi:lipopolysaccharide/colanic/teichoic acid biosynthesis glycosyltransferase